MKYYVFIFANCCNTGTIISMSVRIPQNPYLEPLKVIHVMIKEVKGAALQDGYVSIFGRWRHRKVASMKTLISYVSRSFSSNLGAFLKNRAHK